MQQVSQSVLHQTGGVSEPDRETKQTEKCNERVSAVLGVMMCGVLMACPAASLPQVTMRHMREVIGYKAGDSILAPGGSISNLYAAIAARHKMFPEYKKKGLMALPGQLVMFTSLHSHYSLMGAAAAMGIGTDNLIEVPVDEKGHMLPSELDRLIQEEKGKGKVPFFVCATAGTTVMGAFDPLHAIADVCEKHKLWFHVDVSTGRGWEVAEGRGMMGGRV
ncbi:Glutamate decarboxylase [Portunus trituberculatus]|uniref:Glutamate decarboxylase n=1 Tax=Portunus trituberculatus TaxID=210409 RepID=A0A5B7HDX8_PORTR|nr:Glutamate decarboxylase [Portunus trituberculatus]